MLIGQISDFHVAAPGCLAYGRVDTAGLLGRAVAALNRVEPAPRLVVGTGDLVQTGAAQEYAALRAILQPMAAPFAPIVGNHDSRPALARVFADFGQPFAPAPFIQYALDLGELRLVVIDTVTEGFDEPSFCAARADWLDETLSESVQPVVIAMHHPPFACGVDWLEPRHADWTSRLAKVLERHPCVVRLLAGHVHRAIHTVWRGIPASTAPSTAHQVFPGLAGGEARLSLEAPGFQLHRWTGRELVTYTASTLGFGDVFPT
jgi:3',5'-cyclic AMP phosphodiesterase CpdA